MENKNNPRESVRTLITALGILLGLNLIAVAIYAIVQLVHKNIGFGIGLLLGAIVEGFVLGFVISLLDDAFESIIDVIDPSNKRKRKKSILSTPAPDVKSDNVDTFRKNVDNALESRSIEQQLDWLNQWLVELNTALYQEKDEERRTIYQEELEFIALSISALE